MLKDEAIQMLRGELEASRIMLRTMAHRTRRVYDLLAPFYSLPTLVFHSIPHRCALEDCGIAEGQRVLEVATGTGELFRRMTRAHPSSAIFGMDLSPEMAARVESRGARRCQAADARQMPFRDGAFDAVFCCYLMELLAADDITRALREFRRVLAPEGRLMLAMIGEGSPGFNLYYRLLGRLMPSLWGRQVEGMMLEMLAGAGFEVISDRTVQPVFYPTRILVARC
jgi:ubiquinone/menaquinone biosynthesis C-methylase UbiE